MGILAEDIERVRAATDFVADRRRAHRPQAGGAALAGAVPVPRREVAVVLGQRRGRALLLLRLRARRRRHHLRAGGRAPRLRRGGGAAGRPGRHPDPLRHRGRLPGAPAPGPAGRGHEPGGRVVPPAPARRRPTRQPARAYLRSRGYDGDVGAGLPARAGRPTTGTRCAGPSGCPPTCSGTPAWGSSTSGGRQQDVFRGRVLFPIFDVRGDPVAFGGRAPAREAQGPKYRNSPETPLYSKSRVLYGLNWAKAAVVEAGRGGGLRGLHRRHRAGPRRRCHRRWPPAARPWPTSTSGCSRTSPAGWSWPTTPTPPGRPRPSASTSGSGATSVDIAVADLPPGTDPATWPFSDPEALRRRGRRGPAVPRLPPRSGSWPGRPAHPRRAGPGPPRRPWRWCGSTQRPGAGPVRHGGRRPDRASTPTACGRCSPLEGRRRAARGARPRPARRARARPERPGRAGRRGGGPAPGRPPPRGGRRPAPRGAVRRPGGAGRPTGRCASADHPAQAIDEAPSRRPPPCCSDWRSRRPTATPTTCWPAWPRRRPAGARRHRGRGPAVVGPDRLRRRRSAWLKLAMEELRDRGSGRRGRRTGWYAGSSTGSRWKHEPEQQLRSRHRRESSDRRVRPTAGPGPGTAGSLSRRRRHGRARGRRAEPDLIDGGPPAAVRRGHRPRRERGRAQRRRPGAARRAAGAVALRLRPPSRRRRPQPPGQAAETAQAVAARRPAAGRTGHAPAGPPARPQATPTPGRDAARATARRPTRSAPT